MAKLAMSFKMPVVLSTVNVKTGINRETITMLTDVLKGVTSYDATTLNALEDAEFNEAVKKTGEKN